MKVAEEGRTASEAMNIVKARFPDAKVIASLGGLKDGGGSAFLTYSIYEGPLLNFRKISIKSLVKGVPSSMSVSNTHLTLPTNREV